MSRAPRYINEFVFYEDIEGFVSLLVEATGIEIALEEADEFHVVNVIIRKQRRYAALLGHIVTYIDACDDTATSGGKDVEPSRHQIASVYVLTDTPDLFPDDLNRERLLFEIHQQAPSQLLGVAPEQVRHLADVERVGRDLAARLPHHVANLLDIRQPFN